MPDPRRKLASPPNSARLESGALCYSFAAEAGEHVGDSVEVFLEDDLVGHATIEREQQTGGGVAQVPLTGVPAVAFPAEFRGVLRAAGLEAPAVLIQDATQLLRSFGPPELQAEVCAAHGQCLSVRLAVGTLPEYPREIELHIDKKPLASALSRVPTHAGHPDTLVHDVKIETRGRLPEQGQLELVDSASGAVVLSEPVERVRVMMPILSELDRLRKRCESLTGEVERLSRRMDAMAVARDDNVALDRVDLYYFLLSQRLDREVGSRQLPPQDSTSRASSPAGGPTKPMSFTASEIEGIGFYGIETNGTSEWRWLGPRVTLIFKGVPESARTLTLSFASLAPEVDINGLRATMDGIDVAPSVRAKKKGWIVCLPVWQRVRRPDEAVIAHLSFSSAHVPKNDRRALTAVFVGATIGSE